MVIKVAFYRGKNGFCDKIIRWWTKSPYSHAELILPDGITWIRIGPFASSKLCAIKKEKWDPRNWDFVSITVTSEQTETIKDFFERTKGCKYDWIGMLLSQFLPFHVKRKGKWYCSEWIAYALRISCAIDWRIIKIYDRADLSPAVLYEIVRAK